MTARTSGPGEEPLGLTDLERAWMQRHKECVRRNGGVHIWGEPVIPDDCRGEDSPSTS